MAAAFPFAVFALLAAVSWNRWIEPYIDTGRELMVPWRLAHGERLYRDVQFPHGPLGPYLAAIVDALAGPSLAARLGLCAAVALLHLAALSALSRRLLPPCRAALAVSLAVPTAVFLRPGGWLFPFSFDVALAVAALTAALALDVGNASPRTDAAAGAGVLAAVLSRPELGLAGALILSFAARRQPRRIVALAVAPVAAAAAGYALLSLGTPWRTLVADGWLCLIRPPEAFRNVYRAYAGLDRPALRLAELLLAALAFAFASVFLVAASWRRGASRGLRPTRRVDGPGGDRDRRSRRGRGSAGASAGRPRRLAVALAAARPDRSARDPARRGAAASPRVPRRAAARAPLDGSRRRPLDGRALRRAASSRRRLRRALRRVLSAPPAGRGDHRSPCRRRTPRSGRRPRSSPARGRRSPDFRVLPGGRPRRPLPRTALGRGRNAGREPPAARAGRVDDVGRRSPPAGTAAGSDRSPGSRRPDSSTTSSAAQSIPPRAVLSGPPGRRRRGARDRDTRLPAARRPAAGPTSLAVGEGAPAFGRDYLRDLDAAVRARYRPSAASTGPERGPERESAIPEFFVELSRPGALRRRRASMRLDLAVSRTFGLSRRAAREAVRSGPRRRRRRRRGRARAARWTPRRDSPSIATGRSAAACARASRSSTRTTTC